MSFAQRNFWILRVSLKFFQYPLQETFSLLPSLVLTTLSFFCPQSLLTSSCGPDHFLPHNNSVLSNSGPLRLYQTLSPKHHPSLGGHRHRVAFSTHVTRSWQEGKDGHRERKGWICGLGQPLAFTRINNDTGLFALLQKDFLNDNTPIY